MGDAGNPAAAGCPIPVDLVPPLFYSPNYASDKPQNTEALKRSSRPRVAVHKAALLPLAGLVSRNELDLVKLRDGSLDQTDRLDALLALCECSKAE